MASPVENNVSSNDWFCTQTRGDRIEFEWKIKKFHQLPQENEEMIKPLIVFPKNRTEQWKILLFPRGWGKENAEWISVYLYRASDEMAGLRIKGDITVFQLNKVLGKMELTQKFERQSGYGNRRLVERSKLSVEDDPTDTITIRCKIEILGTYITSSSEKKSSDMMVLGVRENRLTEDFQSFYANPTLSDFTVISGDKKFPTHKAILASRCPVFAAMFVHKEVNENVKNEVKIEIIEPAVVAKLLEFIYTDGVSEIGELAHGLLAAAEQYELKGLKHLCQETLYKTLNEDNAAELLALADLHNATQLKNYIMQFIVEHSKIVFESEAFALMEMPLDLAKEIIRAVASSK